MPSTYELLADALWPVKLMGAIVCAYLVHEYLVDRFVDNHDDEDPDGYA